MRKKDRQRQQNTQKREVGYDCCRGQGAGPAGGKGHWMGAILKGQDPHQASLGLPAT